MVPWLESAVVHLQNLVCELLNFQHEGLVGARVQDGPPAAVFIRLLGLIAHLVVVLRAFGKRIVGLLGV